MNAVGQDINFWDLVAQTTKVDFENLNARQTFSITGIDSYSWYFNDPMLFNQYTSVEDAFRAVEEAFNDDPTNQYFERAKSLIKTISVDGRFDYDKLWTAFKKGAPRSMWLKRFYLASRKT